MSTARSRFTDALRHAQPQTVDQYWTGYRSAWLGDLAALTMMIRGWLQPLEADGLARVQGTQFELDEADLGRYDVEGLKVDLLGPAPKTIAVRPRGGRIVGLVQDKERRITGASGRVDLESDVDRIILLRFLREGGDRAWVTYAGGEKRELTEDLFFELMTQLGGLKR